MFQIGEPSPELHESILCLVASLNCDKMVVRLLVWKQN